MKLNITFPAAALAAILFGLSAPGVHADTGATVSKDRNIKTAVRAIGKGKFDKAIRYLKKEVKKKPDSADAHNLLGYSYRNTGQNDLALDHYTRALSLDPEHKGANEYLGELYLTLNKLAEAEQRLSVLAEACPAGCEEHADLEKAINEYKSKN